MAVHLTWTWFCQECEETGAGEKSDLASRKHEKATGNSTVVHGEPA